MKQSAEVIVPELGMTYVVFEELSRALKTKDCLVIITERNIL